MSGYIIKGHEFNSSKIDHGLYIAATPIGNLSDVTLRVLDTLAGCDLIACEDTRVTGKLLHHFGIKTKKVSYHEHNSHVTGPKLIEKIKGGQSIVLVSDAGTPLVSDPGLKLVEACRSEGLNVIPLPGASAPIAALVASGLPASSWTFAGFLPAKQVARKAILETRIAAYDTLIYFESPNRLSKTLDDMQEVFGPDRLACVAREITKLHEEVITDTLSNLIAHFSPDNVKGEIVILISPAKKDDNPDSDKLLIELLETLSVSKAAAEAAELTGLSKRDLYQRALQLKDAE